MDEDGSGSIAVEELGDPLIGLGLASSKQDVIRMINEVDDDNSGEVEFNEFLNIIKKQKNSEHSIDKFFKKFTNGKVGQKELSFALNV